MALRLHPRRREGQGVARTASIVAGRRGAWLLALLLLAPAALAPAALAQEDVAAEVRGLVPTELRATDLPRLLALQSRAEAAARQGDPRGLELVRTVVLLRRLAQLQDPAHATLRGTDGAPLARSEVSAQVELLLGELRALREGAPSRPRAPAGPVDEVGTPDHLRETLSREVSFLAFDRRVLEMAADPATPLLERVRFLSIAARNLDEFFSVRVAGLKHEIDRAPGNRRSDGYSAEEAYARVTREAAALNDELSRVRQALEAPLAAAGIEVRARGSFDDATRRFAREWLAGQDPVGMRPVTPGALPWVASGEVSLLVTAADGSRSVLTLPGQAPALVALPPALSGGKAVFVLASDLVAAEAARLVGKPVQEVASFRITRNADLWGREGVPGQEYGRAVRLEVSGAGASSLELLRRELALDPRDVSRTSGPVDLGRLAALANLERPELSYPARRPGLPPELAGQPDLFRVIRARDVLLHHPYDSFQPVVDLVRQAGQDPHVEAIRQALYRTGGPDSPVVQALIEAARQGKRVTVVLELRARFDEPNNVASIERLRQAGVEVVFGAQGHKVHAKMLQVVRREGGELRTYTHLGTGNYNAGTARFYTDLGLFTADAAIGRDVAAVFEKLSGVSPADGRGIVEVLAAPFTLQATVLDMIEAELREAQAGRPARIVAKMNSLNDPTIIEALYRASQAGVQIDLVVRGLTTLRPGVPGLSENIRVRSVLGRYLEHSRVFTFHAGGAGKVFISSADWMARNTTRRVEAAIPIKDPHLKSYLQTLLEGYLRDNSGAFQLRPDGSWERVRPGPGELPRSIMEENGERLRRATPPPSPARLAAAPGSFAAELAALDLGLRRTRGLGLEVVEGPAAPARVTPEGLVRISSRTLDLLHTRAMAAGGQMEARLAARSGALTSLVDRAAAAALGAPPLGDPAALLREGVAALAERGEATRAEESARAAREALEGPLGAYRRADLSVDWARAARGGALHVTSGGAKFTLALYLRELGYALATRDPGRLDEFLQAVAATDFYLEYGLFVAGATAGQLGYDLAYRRYLAPHLKRGLMHQLLRSNVALGAGLALPMLAHGEWSGETFVVSLSALGLSSLAVEAGLARIPWVHRLEAGSAAAGASRLLRAGGWVYQAAKLAVVLTVAGEVEEFVHGRIDEARARDALAAAAREVVRALAAARTREEAAAALDAYAAAWDSWRLYLYAPLLQAQARLQGRLQPILRRARLQDDVARAALERAERFPALRHSLTGLASHAEARVAVDPQLEVELQGFQREFEGALARIYAGPRGAGLPLGPLAGLPVDRLGEPFAGAHRHASQNRLQTYADQRAALELLRAACGPRAEEAFASALAGLARQEAEDQRLFSQGGLFAAPPAVTSEPPSATPGAVGAIREGARD